MGSLHIVEGDWDKYLAGNLEEKVNKIFYLLSIGKTDMYVYLVRTNTVSRINILGTFHELSQSELDYFLKMGSDIRFEISYPEGIAYHYDLIGFKLSNLEQYNSYVERRKDSE